MTGNNKIDAAALWLDEAKALAAERDALARSRDAFIERAKAIIAADGNRGLTDSEREEFVRLMEWQAIYGRKRAEHDDRFLEIIEPSGAA
jgi:accessory colonization factor AcfC